jgi:hypothetical protein
MEFGDVKFMGDRRLSRLESGRLFIDGERDARLGGGNA